LPALGFNKLALRLYKKTRKKRVIMNIHTTLLIIAGITMLSSNAFADKLEKREFKKQATHLNTDGNKKKLKKNEKTKPTQKLKYNPPFMGAPSTARLIGMALRSFSQADTNLLLSVLTPTHTGLTTKTQPVLYWYVSKPISKPFQFIEFVLNSEQSTSPVLRTQLPPVTKSGIQKIQLSDYDINLQTDIEYTWSIALVSDPESRSQDFVTSGKIKYIKPKEELQTRIKESSANQHPYIFSQSGVWYDAIAAIIQQTKEYPANALHQNNLISLMEQAELQQIVISMKETTTLEK
jgi:hypothetical protein